MKIKRKSLVFHNVVFISGAATKNQWYDIAVKMRTFVINNDLYPTGPIFYTVQDQENKEEKIFTVYMPINAQIKLTKDSELHFIEKFEVKAGLQFRHLDVEEPLLSSNMLLKACADENKLELVEPFYNIFLDVYGEGVIDVFAPIKGE